MASHQYSRDPKRYFHCMEIQAGGTSALPLHCLQNNFESRHPMRIAIPDDYQDCVLGCVEKDNYEAYFGTVFDNINAFCAGTPTNLVNPEVLKIER
jgi:hypothetical protein